MFTSFEHSNENKSVHLTDQLTACLCSFCYSQQTLSKDQLEAFEHGTFKNKSKLSKKEQEELRKKVRLGGLGAWELAGGFGRALITLGRIG